MDLIYNITGVNGDIKIDFTSDGVKDLEDAHGSIVFTFYNGKYVMTYHNKRKGWEFPKGKREKGETPLECALRETLEETGAILASIEPLGYYNVTSDSGVFKTAIYKAEVDRFETKPRWSETDLVKLFDILPDNLSFKDDVYKITLEYIRSIE
ncbi:NUDIX hydrolase [Dethiothermospora halolimnae]|uniref:NUDIX hydrolase n=1 Tax=Dethiothermospora halolimnae TaxID=3114390 RepID=UPI003CCB7860